MATVENSKVWVEAGVKIRPFETWDIFDSSILDLKFSGQNPGAGRRSKPFYVRGVYGLADPVQQPLGKSLHSDVEESADDSGSCFLFGQPP